MKTELRVKEHGIIPGHKAVELWYNDIFIGTIYGNDGPGFRVVTRQVPESSVAMDQVEGLIVLSIRLDKPIEELVR